jgi:pyruvate formate lyase activating enzyme
MDCVKACINNALNVAGRTYTVDELMRVLKRDQDFWGSQGGVTFSGGEPLLQKEFISDILKQCRIHYINTCVETCAHTDTTFLMEILRFTDWMFIDIKHMDSSLHRKETGAGNELILKNIKTMASSGWTGRLVIRVPLIPGYNDTAENLQTTADFLNSLNLKEINILSLHPYGNSKYEQLGLEILHADRISSSRQDMLEVRQFFEARGLQCYIDSDTPF